ncbi:hypothetical protein M5K25_026280 [Dendrobium thyrsiflorum]|uniref:Homeobox domain-containing protein n=1 Tax=Dendrobium thyrsiflorum TaxID=117978 RepID=A0ABD0TX63_DENTH
MLQSHEAFSFRGFFPRSGGFLPINTTETESIIIMAETDWGEQQKTQLIVNDSSMRGIFPASHEEPSLSSSARFHQQPFPERVLYCGSELQSMTFQGVESYNNTYNNVKISKYLNPAKDLLHEICNVGEEVVGADSKEGMLLLKKGKKAGESSSSSPSSTSSSLFSLSLKTLDMLELLRMKANLMKLLEEVERRYKRFRERRTSLVWSFEASAGGGAAIPYLAATSKAMSRHFRRLKDGILEQIQVLKKVMMEKNHIVPGMLRGQTPRLKLLNQSFQQRKAFQEGRFVVDNQMLRTHRGLPECSVSVLRAWLLEHFLHPYPRDIDKRILTRQTGLSRSQVSNWFINARVRLWKPMIEEMYMEQIEQSEALHAEDKNCNANPNSLHENDKEQNLIAINETESESGSLSTIVNVRHRYEEHGFSFYNGYNTMENFSGSGVNLTLGLQQNEGESIEFFLSKTAESSLLKKANGGPQAVNNS